MLMVNGQPVFKLNSETEKLYNRVSKRDPQTLDFIFSSVGYFYPNRYNPTFRVKGFGSPSTFYVGLWELKGRRRRITISHLELVTKQYYNWDLPKGLVKFIDHLRERFSDPTLKVEKYYTFTYSTRKLKKVVGVFCIKDRRFKSLRECERCSHFVRSDQNQVICEI